MLIDVHNHVIPRRVVEQVRRSPSAFAARIEEGGGVQKVVHDQGYEYPLFEEFYDPQAKLASMDRKGIDVAIISPAPPLFYYWADAELAGKVARLANDGVAEMVAAAPSRLHGMGTIPMQHPDLAVEEMDRVARKYEFKAIEIGTSVEGAQLSDAAFRPILHRAMELKLFVFAHPYYIGKKPGLESYYLTNLIGNPLDTTTMVANLMYSGALDELCDLRICLAHGGGFTPYQIGRFVHGHKVRAEAREYSLTSPRDLLGRFYFDSLVFEPQALRFLIDLVGADRICVGTDSPFDMGDENPKHTVASIPRLTEAERHAVCSGTALRLVN